MSHKQYIHIHQTWTKEAVDKSKTCLQEILREHKFRHRTEQDPKIMKTPTPVKCQTWVQGSQEHCIK